MTSFVCAFARVIVHVQQRSFPKFHDDENGLETGMQVGMALAYWHTLKVTIIGRY